VAKPDDTTGEGIDTSPVLPPDPLDLRVSLSSLVHWADSYEHRRTVMAAVEFPVDDMAMFLVVNQLGYRGALRPSELATILGTGRPNMSKIANRLCESGLTARVPDPDDDRSVLLALTPAGRKVGERIMDYARTTTDGALELWSADDVEALKRFLARLVSDTTAARSRRRPR
jgi:DNA-binding MarR family transcriptional regulator